MTGVDAIDECVKPLTKLDIIRKFDKKSKMDKSIDTGVISNPTADNKCIEKFSHLSGTTADNIDANNPIDEDCIDDLTTIIDQQQQQLMVATTKNGHSNNENGSSGQIPPKPLPRTSRNNSVSSDQGFVMIGDEITPRPVAKPRNIASTTYKVHPIKSNNKLFIS